MKNPDLFSKSNKKRKELTRREFLETLFKVGAGAAVGGTTVFLNKEKKIEEKEKTISDLEEKIGKLEQLLKIKKEFTNKKIKVIATGYTSGPESTGKKPGHPTYGITKSGWPANIGAIAVDPNVIPFGSILYVPGYGYGIAIDTGRNIKGNRIDLYFHKVSDAKKWGKKNIEVIILGKIELPKNKN